MKAGSSGLAKFGWLRILKKSTPSFMLIRSVRHGLFVEREIPLFESRTAQGIASHVAEVASSNLTIGGDSASHGHARIDGARNRERSEIQIMIGIALVIDDGADDIGTIEGVAAATVVIPEVVIQVEGLSALQSENAVESPTVLQLLRSCRPWSESRSQNSR